MRMFVSLAALATLVVAVQTTDLRAADEDTPLAAKTRKLLKQKISVDFSDMRLEEAMDEIKSEVKGLKFLLDTKGGVSRNMKVSAKAKDKTVEEILDMMFKKPDLGYIIISKKNNAYDGLLQVRKSSERGYEKK